MTTLEASTAPAPASAEDGPAVRRWLGRLDARIGMSAAERTERRGALLAFCAARATDPERLLSEWEDYPELLLRQTAGARGAAYHTAVESFLIHNGVNVFGAIVCMPGTPEQLREQGEKFVPRDAEPSDTSTRAPWSR